MTVHVSEAPLWTMGVADRWAHQVVGAFGGEPAVSSTLPYILVGHFLLGRSYQSECYGSPPKFVRRIATVSLCKVRESGLINCATAVRF